MAFQVKRCDCDCASQISPCTACSSLACGLECQSSGSIDVLCGPFYPGVTNGPAAQCDAVNVNCLGGAEGDPGMIVQTVQYRFNCIGLTIGQWYRIDYNIDGIGAQVFFQATATSELTPLTALPLPSFPGTSTVTDCAICAVPAEFDPCP